MHAVSRPFGIQSMLGLPVDRLVGVGGQGHPRLSLTPDSSDSGSVRSPSPPPQPPLTVPKKADFSRITLLLSPKTEEPEPGREHESEDSDSDPGLSTSRSSEPHCCDPDNRERPPSSASGSSTGTLGLGRPGPTPTAQQQQSLKFSIHDILRPDFGQGALRRAPLVPSRRGSGGTGRPARPSSVKTVSEDSNSSTASRVKEEVVDEAKVNPEVPKGPMLWPAWVYCTRYSDRPSSGPRSRRIVRKADEPRTPSTHHESPDEKRPRTAFTAEQLGKLKQEFDENRYLTEKRRQDLARDLKLHENQIKIWFQNKRAKLKKSSGTRGGLALQLMAQGLYNHSTVPMDEDEDYLPC